MTTTACGRRRLSDRTDASSTCAVSASWGRKVGAEDPAEAVEERHARGRLLVAHVGVGDLREGGERGDAPAAAAELVAVAQRLARAALERAVAVAVDERGVERRARRRAGRPPHPQPAASSTTARISASRITPPAARRRSARASRAARRRPSPTAASASTPAMTSRTCASVGASSSDGEAGGERADQRPERHPLEHGGGERGGHRDRERRARQHERDRRPIARRPPAAARRRRGARAR